MNNICISACNINATFYIYSKNFRLECFIGDFSKSPFHLFNYFTISQKFKIC